VISAAFRLGLRASLGHIPLIMAACHRYLQWWWGRGFSSIG